jgi:hypothetical protein
MNAGGFRHHRRLDRGVRGQVLDDAAIEDDTGFEAADRRMFDTLEVLLTLHFMGGPVTLEKAVILESLGMCGRPPQCKKNLLDCSARSRVLTCVRP